MEDSVVTKAIEKLVNRSHHIFKHLAIPMEPTIASTQHVWYSDENRPEEKPETVEEGVSASDVVVKSEHMGTRGENRTQIFAASCADEGCGAGAALLDILLGRLEWSVINEWTSGRGRSMFGLISWSEDMGARPNGSRTRWLESIDHWAREFRTNGRYNDYVVLMNKYDAPHSSDGTVYFTYVESEHVPRGYAIVVDLTKVEIQCLQPFHVFPVAVEEGADTKGLMAVGEYTLEVHGHPYLIKLFD
jgi:hypothetical protein